MPGAVEMITDEVLKREAARMGDAAPTTLERATPGSTAWKRLADAAYWGGVGADQASTVYGLAQPGRRYVETNPMYAWAGDKFAVPVSLGVDVLTNLLLDRVLDEKPKLRNAIKFGLGGMRGTQAVKNLQLMRDR